MYHLNVTRCRQGQYGGTLRPPDCETVDLTGEDSADLFPHLYDAETGKREEELKIFYDRLLCDGTTFL